jgi:hypothetical protein
MKRGLIVVVVADQVINDARLRRSRKDRIASRIDKSSGNKGGSERSLSDAFSFSASNQRRIQQKRLHLDLEKPLPPLTQK